MAQENKGQLDTDPKLLMEVAEWWILTHKLDHFEKAGKIRAMINEDK